MHCGLQSHHKIDALASLTRYWTNLVGHESQCCKTKCAIHLIYSICQCTFQILAICESPSMLQGTIQNLLQAYTQRHQSTLSWLLLQDDIKLICNNSISAPTFNSFGCNHKKYLPTVQFLFVKTVYSIYGVRKTLLQQLVRPIFIADYYKYSNTF